MNGLAFWIGLATVLISQDINITNEEIRQISPYVIYSATAHEALDYGQWYNHFTSPICLDSDLEGIRGKMNHLRKLPHIVEIAEWGTTRGELLKHMEANRQFHLYLENLKGLGILWNPQVLQITMDENNLIYNAMDWLQYTECGHLSRYQRRNSLSRVRSIVGEDAFNRRQTIPFLPYWRFHQIP